MRRTFVTEVHPGSFPLPPAEAHHLRDVLRLSVGDPVELFDAVGTRGIGVIKAVDRDGVVVCVEQIERRMKNGSEIHIASAVPKAERADWLVEKLSEVGVARWTPLRTARSVVHPEGVTKFDRWRRLAIEAAKQSRRAGVMEIGELTSLDDYLAPLVRPSDAGSENPASVTSTAAETAMQMPAAACVLSTRAGSVPLLQMAAEIRGRAASSVHLLIGPEGGWTDDELATMTAGGMREVSLGATILRIETAAVVGAGVVHAALPIGS